MWFITASFSYQYNPDILLLNVEKFRNKVRDRKLYGHCFSYSIDESVAMWMLYGGNKQEGGMFYFTKKQMLQIIDNCKK